jgi:hypothetical protein
VGSTRTTGLLRAGGSKGDFCDREDQQAECARLSLGEGERGQGRRRMRKRRIIKELMVEVGGRLA